MRIDKNERLQLLKAQNELAHQKWRYLEESRIKLVEIFLVFISATAFGIIFSEQLTGLSLSINNYLIYLIPLLFYCVGLSFYSFFWFREIYYRITKSWIKRIEEEIQVIINNDTKRIKKPYEGSYYLYYYQPSSNFDLVTQIASFIFVSLTIIISTLILIMVSQGIMENCWVLLIIVISIFPFYIIKTWIIKHFEKGYRENSDKYPPKLKSEKNT